jgi:hypothetical protein
MANHNSKGRLHRAGGGVKRETGLIQAAKLYGDDMCHSIAPPLATAPLKRTGYPPLTK